MMSVEEDSRQWMLKIFMGYQTSSRKKAVQAYQFL